MNRTEDSLERRPVEGRPSSLNLNEVNKVLAYMQNPATNYVLKACYGQGQE